MSGLQPKQFLLHVVRPVHEHLGMGGRAADELVLGTCLTESGLEWLKQLGGGPAEGVAQMEPATFRDLLERFIVPRGLLPLVRRWSIGEPTPEQMRGNLYLAVAMCRLHYRRVPAPLPAAGDAMALAQYWKRYYNTPLGKGDPAVAVIQFEKAIAAVRSAP